ncbi:hypothetical protein JM83_1531 [Gillisia sp. Hel_I_86]|uniref:hypothetical protein n=1 Tax=Gillisia sp. Hel_I_86 TaxID=1249981 RepID=UPI0011994AB6|nr:hypothetical protein [Gillisia sp. Hel_I_86]TVZ26557.1 hypothetical protein JM83_1531 [Gillisia sp. Hel_I_86]
MNKFKPIIIITIISILLISFSSYGNSGNTFLIKNKAIKDSILIFKSGATEIIKIDSNKNIESKTVETINYHFINFDTKKIILLFKRKGMEWKSQSFQFYSTNVSSETIEFIATSAVDNKIYLDINPFNTIVYSLKDAPILSFSGLKQIDIKEFDKLGIYNWKDSNEQVESSKQIIIKERITDFEYSEYWRKESFKKAIDYINQILSQQDPKCELVRRSTYNPSIVRYLGNQGLRIKIYAEYDCNQSYVNEAYFWIDAYYLGYGKWSLELEKHKLTH